MFHRIKSEGWLPEGVSIEHPLQELIDSSRLAAVKLSGALSGARDGRWPPESWAAGDVLVRLKRSRAALRDALRMVEVCEEQGLGDSDWLGETRAELQFMSKAVNQLIDEVRGSLEGQ